MNIIILSHERSLNKAEGLLRAYKDDNVILVIDKTPDVNVKPYTKEADRIIVSKGFDVVHITSKLKTCDKIWCVSENLLPVQNQLESYYGIDNLTAFAAEVLSNKQKFDDFCRSIGLEEYVPMSITPTFHNHLDKLNGREMFSKPDIGTGSNVFFPGDNQNIPSIEYRRWNNKHHFLSYLKSKDIHNKFFELNQTGIYSQRFNFKQCKIFFQEYFWSEEPTLAPYGYIKDGKLKILFYVKSSKINYGETIDPLSTPIESHVSSRSSDIGRERAVWIVMPNDVDENIHNKSLYFLETIVKNLKIKDLFFAGPDFHIIDNHMKAIDFNPRPGQFINVLNNVNDYKIFKQIVTGNKVEITKKAMYACPILKPGIVKDISSLDGLKKYLIEDKIDIKVGTQIPKFQHLFNKSFNLTFYIDGNSEQELFDNYKTANQLLQNCITY